MPVSILVSNGQSTVLPDGTTVPAYDTPGRFNGSIDGTVLTVATMGQGRLAVGQTLRSASDDILPGTLITGLLTGAEGIGTYTVNQTQTVASEDMITNLVLQAQIQPLTFRDIQQIDGLNLQGTRRSFYLNGAFDGLSRPFAKGGDIILVAFGPNAGVWLVAFNSEQWPDWCKVICTLQNDSISRYDFSDPNNSMNL